jgi:PadR family transcriptional regulator AphA
MAEDPRLTTTSYAILGWLSVRPWSTYELAKQMRANLSLFWPRAESRLYEEPKNLVARGLATRERSHLGRRPRTVYRITEAGRRALAEWQSHPSAPPSLDFEGLVRLYFAGSATPADMRAAVDSARAHAETIFAEGGAAMAAYLSGRHPFPQRAQFSGFIADFLWSYAELLSDWAERSAAEIASWQDTSPDGEKRARALAIFEDCLERLQRRQGSSETPPPAPGLSPLPREDAQLPQPHAQPDVVPPNWE